MKKSCTVVRPHQHDSPQRHLPLVDLLVDTRAELFELAIASGLRVLTTMLEEDRTAVCGARYAHQTGRVASRAGTAQSVKLSFVGAICLHTKAPEAFSAESRTSAWGRARSKG